MDSNRTLKILLISKTLPWQFKGGIQTHTWELAKSLVEIGHSVTILNGGPFRSKTTTFLKDGIEVVQIPFFPGRYLKPVSLLAEEFSFNWSVLTWTIKNHQPFDIIHSQGRSGYLLSFFKPIKNRLVNTVHGLLDIESQHSKWYSLNANLHNAFTKKVENRLYNKAARLVAVSTALKGELSEKRFVQQPIQVISNGVNTFPKTLSLKNNAARFLFIGRLHPIKGIAKMIEQMDLANENISLDIVGNGSERDAIVRIIEAKGLQKKVKLLGELTSEEIHNILPHYTALVLPSLYETQGIVLLEANSEGVPVIASDLPAIRETITHGENGLLCPTNNPVAFIEAMNYMANHRQEAEMMGSIGRIKVEAEYSWNKIAVKTESLYYSIAS